MKLMEINFQSLYHTSPLKYAYNILYHNELCCSRQTGGSSAISVSRDKNHIRYGLQHKNYAIFELDKNKLLTKYKIVPYSENESHKDGQFEEHIKSDILSLNKYLVSIKYVINTKLDNMDDGFLEELKIYKNKFKIK